jgi:hypothetical protein
LYGRILRKQPLGKQGWEGSHRNLLISVFVLGGVGWSLQHIHAARKHFGKCFGKCFLPAWISPSVPLRKDSL